MFETLETVVRHRDERRAVEGARRAGVECVDDEARLARSRQAGDAGEGAERDFRGDILQIVRARALQHQVETVAGAAAFRHLDPFRAGERSEEHTSELQSLMRISYAVVCLKKKTTRHP